MKRAGRKTKDAHISDAFNPNKISDLISDIDRIRKERRDLRKVESTMKKASSKAIKAAGDVYSPDTRLLRDVRSLYHKTKGKKKLEEMFNDDKEFRFLIKELLKAELALLTTKIRMKETDPQLTGNMATMVVLKGLETEANVFKSDRPEDVDVDQIGRAINPEEEYKSSEDEEVVDRAAAPDQLQGSQVKEG